MTKHSENTALMQTSFQGLNDLLRLQNYITRHKTSVEKSGNFCYNAYTNLVFGLYPESDVRKQWTRRKPPLVQGFPKRLINSLIFCVLIPLTMMLSWS
jgi:hypothetical protein